MDIVDVLLILSDTLLLEMEMDSNHWQIIFIVKDSNLDFISCFIDKPVMGWNSYDSFTGRLDEATFRKQIDYLSKYLAPFGYEYLVIDAGWYLSFDTKDGWCSDGYSRCIVDPIRYPSSQNGNGFKPLADYIHSKGLKFGFHIMRGIPQDIVNKNEKIMGTQYHASDIAIENEQCQWWSDWWGINTSHPAAQAYYNSLFELYAEWDTDFVKMDCTFANDYHKDDIIAVHNAIKNCGRDIVLSLSPGGGSQVLDNAMEVASLTNMFRITNDLWDCWDDDGCNVGYSARVKQDVKTFTEFYKFIGQPGFNGLSFPDGDMLPIGYLTMPGSPLPAYRPTNFTHDEQITLLSLWSIFRNPLILGSDLTQMDDWTLKLVTNPEVIDLNQNSKNNQPLWEQGTLVAWTANHNTKPGVYVGIFNTGDFNITIGFDLSDVSVKGTCDIRDLWARKTSQAKDLYNLSLNAHGASLFFISNCQN